MALSLCIIVWIIFIFLYDAGFIMFVIITSGNFMINKINILLLINPVEIFRLLSIIIFIPEDITDLFNVHLNFSNNGYIIFFFLLWPLFIFITFLKTNI